jgi:hypothetical protein
LSQAPDHPVREKLLPTSIAYDADGGSLTFYKNGASQGVAYTGIDASTVWFFGATSYTGGSTSFNFNFGQRPFAYTIPTGFVALNTYNLPTPTILQGNKYMDATLYTGTGTSQVIVNQALFKPDFVWMKSRNDTQYNVLQNSNTGAGKTLTMATIADNFYLYSKDLKAFKCLIIVPDLGLVNQTYKEFLEYNVSFTVTRWTGSLKPDFDANIIIANIVIIFYIIIVINIYMIVMENIPYY